MWYALGYSIEGLAAGWHEPAFREEVLLSLVLIPISFFLGQNWVETALLSGSLLLILTVELLNTAIESAIDRVSPEWHELSKRAKDMGSAAVLLVIVLGIGIWGAAIVKWLMR